MEAIIKNILYLGKWWKNSIFLLVYLWQEIIPVGNDKQRIPQGMFDIIFSSQEKLPQ